MSTARKIIIVVFIAVVLTGCDLVTKKIASGNLKGKAVQTYLGGTLQLFYTENSGGMLSIGSTLPGQIKFTIFVIGITLLLVFLFLYSVFKKNLELPQFLACVLFLSGGLGNLVDRIFNNGNVVDFIIIRVFGLSTGVFNFADLYVTVGLFILTFSMLNFKKRLFKNT